MRHRLGQTRTHSCGVALVMTSGDTVECGVYYWEFHSHAKPCAISSGFMYLQKLYDWLKTNTEPVIMMYHHQQHPRYHHRYCFLAIVVGGSSSRRPRPRLRPSGRSGNVVFRCKSLNLLSHLSYHRHCAEADCHRCGNCVVAIGVPAASFASQKI